jgi:hypothetical protein
MAMPQNANPSSSGVMLLHFVISRKLNTTLLEHNCILANCCCDDVCSVQALSGIKNGMFQEVPTDIFHHP